MTLLVFAQPCCITALLIRVSVSSDGAALHGHDLDLAAPLQDYTGSNKDTRDPASLHYIGAQGERQTLYEEAIVGIARVLEVGTLWGKVHGLMVLLLLLHVVRGDGRHRMRMLRSCWGVGAMLWLVLSAFLCPQRHCPTCVEGVRL